MKHIKLFLVVLLNFIFFKISSKEYAQTSSNSVMVVYLMHNGIELHSCCLAIDKSLIEDFINSEHNKKIKIGNIISSVIQNVSNNSFLKNNNPTGVGSGSTGSQGGQNSSGNANTENNNSTGNNNTGSNNSTGNSNAGSTGNNNSHATGNNNASSTGILNSMRMPELYANYFNSWSYWKQGGNTNNVKIREWKAF